MPYFALGFCPTFFALRRFRDYFHNVAPARCRVSHRAEDTSSPFELFHELVQKLAPGFDADRRRFDGVAADNEETAVHIAQGFG